MAFIDIDEATLSESAAGEATVLDELPEPQSREIRSLLEQGELPPPVAVDFDSPLASWRTVELIVQATDEVSDRGLVELEEQITVRVSFPPTIGIERLEGYRTIGRAAFFVDSSAVFDGAEGIQLDGQLVGVLSEADEIISMPFLEDELADQWLEANPTIASLTEARLSAAS